MNKSIGPEVLEQTGLALTGGILKEFLKDLSSNILDAPVFIRGNTLSSNPEAIWVRNVFRVGCNQQGDCVLSFGDFNMYPSITSREIITFLEKEGLSDTHKIYVECSNQKFHSTRQIFSVVYTDQAGHSRPTIELWVH